ncbi:Hypothetical protein A7982_09571 [Minicystis rosea]|nr:Hypothetical protein A7982_09571 [Minicystis rosea]
MDVNLRYAILDCITPYNEHTKRLRGVTSQEAKDYLATLPLDISAGKRSDGLVWRSGGPDGFLSTPAYAAVYGRGDEAREKAGGATTIRSIAGIEVRSELTLVDLEDSSLSDLTPLLALRELRRVRVGVTASCDLAPLRELPLERVEIQWATTPAQQAILAELEARGVMVDGTAPDWAALSAPFACKNLKLAVLSRLADEGVFELPAFEVRFSEYEHDQGILRRVLSIPLTEDALASIETLDWVTGGLDIHHLINEQWDGESGEFDITSLRGLEALPNLRSLDVSSAGEVPEEDVEAQRARGVTIVA